MKEQWKLEDMEEQEASKFHRFRDNWLELEWEDEESRSSETKDYIPSGTLPFS
ncbi:MAG: hypothetical protein HRU19_10230 [Pseudobacteriovorax sp.]|nr:hypothetical protein [Pseudobacteriovorax sp.]